MQVEILDDEFWSLQTADGKTIYGITNSAVDTDRCIVMVHGLTGHMNEFQNKVAASCMAARGYDVIRFNLYGGGENSRILTDCRLQIHAADLNAVLEEKTKSYKKVFLSGHSYGGPTVMIAEPKMAKAIYLWDPSFDLPSIWSWDDVKLVHRNNMNLFQTQVESVLSDEFVEEAKTQYGEKECLALSESINAPILVLHADGFRYAKQTTSWHSAGHPDNKHILLEDTDHCFWNNQNIEKVLKHTLNWFDTYSEENA